MSTNKTFLTALQWLSPAFPIGSFAYSHGLEWAIEKHLVTDQISLQNWLQDLLGLGSARSDAILLALAFKSESKAELIYLNQLALALSASAERRSETLLQGQSFGKTIRDVWGQGCTDLCYPVALGAAARRENLIKEDIIAAYLHAFSTNLISAAIRLVPLGQTQGQHILLALTPEIKACAAEASEADEDDLSSTTFLSDVASMRHETLHTRIFKT
jgi:urease accessory protein